MKDVYKNYTEKNIEMLYISVESREKASAYAKNKELPYAVLVDADAAVAKKLGVSAIPAHFILDADGKVLFSNVGKLKNHEKLLNDLVAELEADKEKG